MLNEMRAVEGHVFAGEAAYVPPNSAVVAPGVLAEVFQDGVLPFTTNADGSVDTSVYMTWLNETWAAGMAQFEDQSDEHLPSAEVNAKQYAAA
jgi:hypothetical protein